MTEDPHELLLSMLEKIEDPQLRAALGYMGGIIKALEIKVSEGKSKKAEDRAYAVYKVLISVDGSKFYLYRGNAEWGPFHKSVSGIQALGKAVAENLKIQAGVKEGK